MKLQLKSGQFVTKEKTYVPGDTMEVESWDDLPKPFHAMWFEVEEPEPKKKPARKKARVEKVEPEPKVEEDNPEPPPKKKPSRRRKPRAKKE